jgi:hypothetical protein
VHCGKRNHGDNGRDGINGKGQKKQNHGIGGKGWKEGNETEQ